MESQRCKGARDLLAEDMERFRQVEDAFRNSCINWGYREIKTPTLEYIHLFTAAGTLTPAMLSRVYSFLDWDGWGGERIVLRPDGTIPAARLYSENFSGSKIARLYYVTNVFAFEETGKENREKWQCGVELLGDGNPTSEAEIIGLALEVLNTLGLAKASLKLSHAGVLKALIAELKLNTEEKADLLDEILEGNWQALSKVNGNKKIAAAVSTLMNLKGRSSGFLVNLAAMPGLSRSIVRELEAFAGVTGLLDTLGYKYEIDFTSIKGFEYYTGLCFKIRANNTKVCSGGRYDNLVGLVGGGNVPACGFALYLDELAAQVRPWSRQKAEKTVIVRVDSAGAESVKEAFKLSAALRSAGLIAELDFRGSQLDARWEISVQEKKPGYTVKDKIKNLQKKAADTNEVVNIIGGFGKVG
ncbi:MAG: ATP phosphoribosyltransferase regulatory subunit [Dehalococcoidia bacterium]|nr:ATP phosphoribosyltransferase regulatory subunit [Dehalococcoidia bacterium]